MDSKITEKQHLIHWFCGNIGHSPLQTKHMLHKSFWKIYRSWTICYLHVVQMLPIWYTYRRQHEMGLEPASTASSASKALDKDKTFNTGTAEKAAGKSSRFRKHAVLSWYVQAHMTHQKTLELKVLEKRRLNHTPKEIYFIK